MTIPFIDSFDGAGAQTNLESWTPTGGTAWTLDSGVSGAAKVETDGAITGRTATTSVYLCDDQGTDDHYVEAQISSLTALIDNVCARLVDGSNYIAFRITGTGATGCELRKRVSGTNTALITRQGSADEHLRIEVDGADGAAKVRWYEGGTGSSHGTWSQIDTEQTVTDSVFNGETSSGVVIGSNSTVRWIKLFESGPIATATVPTLSASTYVPGSLTSTGWRPQITAS